MHFFNAICNGILTIWRSKIPVYFSGSKLSILNLHLIKVISLPFENYLFANFCRQTKSGILLRQIVRIPLHIALKKCIFTS
jgi:hypothetical protein